jgi:prepilin-type N-terminal cleavage/methylation domain-containing protein
MRTRSTKSGARFSRRAFTLAELMVAMSVGLVLAGTAMVLLLISATEQRNGFADTSVEERAYILEDKITTCVRSASCNQGFTPNYGSGLYDGKGNFLGYQTISLSYLTNGAYIMASISYNSSSGQVIYTPNVTAPSTQFIWMSNTPSAVLTELCFNTSLNMDTSQNNSLVNVIFQMNDDGFSQQNPSNNPASIYRNFSVQMRNDN